MKVMILAGRAVRAALLSGTIAGGLSLYAQAPLDIIPLPAKATAGAGQLSVDRGLKVTFSGYTEDRLERARERFLQDLVAETGVPLVPASPGDQPALSINVAGPSAPVQQLGEDESYRLEVTPAGATLNAPNPLGALHGLQTFLQLVHSTPQGFAADAIAIEDHPRFPWRGLMVDTGRHFMPLAVIRQDLDGMEAVKLNVLHWHLSEDQGFRIESKTFPLLHEKGSDGLYYTQDEVRGVIEYARDRGIRVIPEFDMPGHATAWFVGYPELASGKGPYRIERQWGVFDPAMDPTSETTYEFLDRFIAEMTSLFPDAYFHIGGDECNGKEWDANPRIQQYMREHGLKDDAALQAYFTGRVQQLVTRRGKITIGWDEVLQPGTPKDVVIQSWRGQDSLAQAARSGYRGLLSAGFYIDLNEPASRHYAVDPLEGATSSLTPEQQKFILGGEAPMWAEFVTPENVATRIWPRTAAIAERLWSPQSTKDMDSMYARLELLSQHLAYRGITYRATSERMMQRIAGKADLSAIETLASVVQPPKGYAREQLAKYYSYSPLNHLVDAVSPESDRGREFQALAARIASGKAAQADWQQARTWLTAWQKNDAALQPLLKTSPLTAELAPLSRNISQTAAIGLSALDALEHRQPFSPAVLKQNADSLKAMEAPQAVLVNTLVPGVELLVNAAK